MGIEDEYNDAFGEASGEEPTGSAAEAPVGEAPEADGGDPDDGAFDEQTGDEPAEEGGDEPAAEEGDEPAAEDGGDEPAAEEGDEPTAEEGDESAAEESGDEPAAEEGGDEPAARKPADGSIDEEALAAAYRRLAEEEEKRQQGDQGEQPQGQEQTPQEKSPREKTWQDYVSEDDRKVIDEYESEWSEVSQAEQIKRDAQLRHMQDVVYSDVTSALAPIVEEIQRSKVEAHFNAIRQVHSDFDDIRENVAEWVNEQPEFLRPAFEQVLQKGSAQQVNELIATYKQSTGKTGAAPEVPASSASKGERKPKRNPPSKSAKRALAATPSPKRSDPPSSADPDNFAAAFDEAAGGM